MEERNVENFQHRVMYIYVCRLCMYACFYLCMYVCMYVCKYVCIYACMYECMCVCVCVCVCIHIFMIIVCNFLNNTNMGNHLKER